MLVLTHEKADFDAIASLLGAKKLFPEATALLPRQLNRNVEQFLTLYWDVLPFVRPQEWRRGKVERVLLVDAHSPGLVRSALERPLDGLTIQVIDHHLDYEPQPGWSYQVEGIGATATLLVEKLQTAGKSVTAEEATLLLLGIYEDTGSLSYDTTTARDACAAAWLLEQGAQLPVARQFLAIPLSSGQRALYDELLRHTKWVEIHDRSILITTAAAPKGFDDEISAVAHRLRETLTPDALFVLVEIGDGVQVVARSGCEEIDVSRIARELGGGGHSRAAAAMVVDETLAGVEQRLRSLLPHVVEPATLVSAIMSYGVQTLPTTMTISEAAAFIQRHGHEGYPLYDERKQRLAGLLTRRAVDRAMGHGMGELPVSRIMKAGSVAVRPSDSLEQVRQLMLDEGWGQVPVLAEEDGEGSNGQRPIGIVTRTDILNALFGPTPEKGEQNQQQLLAESLSPPLWGMVQAVGKAAAELQMPLYFVGGIVRDMLLQKRPSDLDMVVEGDAIELVQHLQQRYGGEVHTHGRFGTAKWSLTPQMWQVMEAQAELEARTNEPLLTELPASIDFVTARKEFYRQPTALPDVERGSIKLDLHRRDFTINTLAIRLDGAYLGELLDFYGGRRDLERGLIRVLHSLSFVDDPTRILRAARLEQRLGFQIEPHTAELIDDALPLLARVTGERIRHELELALAEADPVRVMERLDGLGVLAHIYPGLSWPAEAAAAFRRVASYTGHPLWGQTLAEGPPVFYYYALWLASFPAAVQRGVSRRLKTKNATEVDVVAVAELGGQLAKLAEDARPSVVTRLLRPFAPRVLLAVRILHEGGPIAALIDRFVDEWQHVQTVISGHDLRQMGLTPGPQYGRLLERLLEARLDGEISDEAGERELLAKLLESG